MRLFKRGNQSESSHLFKADRTVSVGGGIAVEAATGTAERGRSLHVWFLFHLGYPTLSSVTVNTHGQHESRVHPAKIWRQIREETEQFKHGRCNTSLNSPPICDGIINSALKKWPLLLRGIKIMQLGKKKKRFLNWKSTGRVMFQLVAMMETREKPECRGRV